MEQFHKRHKVFLITAALGGFYIEGLEKIIRQKCLRHFIRIYAIVASTTQILSLFSSIIHLIFKAKLLTEYFYDLQAIFANILVSFNFLYIELNRTKYFSIFTSWDQLFASDADAQVRKKFMDVEVKQVVNIMTICSFLLSSLPLWMLCQFFMVDKTIKFPVPFEYRHQSPDFELLVAFYFIIFAWFSTNTIIISFLQILPFSWEIAELRRLKWHISEILEKHSSCSLIRVSTVTTNEESLKQMVKAWIVQHQKLCRYHALVQPMYAPQFGVQLFSTMMTSWMLSYVIGAAIYPIGDILFLIFFFLPQYLILFLACKMGNQIEEESRSLFDEAMDKKWHENSVQSQKLLLFIVMRSKRCLNFNAFHKFPLGFHTFFKIRPSVPPSLLIVLNVSY